MGQIGVGTNMGFSLRSALVHTLKKVIRLNKEDLGGAEITQICGRERFSHLTARSMRVDPQMTDA